VQLARQREDCPPKKRLRSLSTDELVDLVASWLFGDDPTEEQQSLAMLICEAVLNVRAIAEATTALAVPQKDLKRALRGLPLNRFI
jgi:hypothetical protein